MHNRDTVGAARVPFDFETLLALDQEVLDAIPAPLYVCAAAGALVRFNAGAAELWGYSPEAGGESGPWLREPGLLRPDGTPLKADETPVAVALATGEPQRDIEVLIDRPGDRRIVALVDVTPLTNAAGQVRGAVSCMRDVTAHRRAEAELRVQTERAQRYTSIVEFSEDAIVSKDLNGIITGWNRGAERLFGYLAEDVIGKSITLLIPPEHEDEEPIILERIRRGERIEHYETVRRRKDGTSVDISLTVSPLKDASGRIVGAAKIARDITARKRTEEALTRHVAEQTALYRFTDRLHRAVSPHDVHEAALDAILEALRCSCAAILLADEAGVMRFAAWRGLSETYRRAVDGHSPWQKDAADPQPVWLDDIDGADLSDALKETIRSEHIGALAFIPLVAGGRLIGKFMAYYETPHRFTAPELALAIAIARQLAVAVQRMRTETARRTAEASQRESERRLEFALAAGEMGAWEWDVAADRVIWSPGLERIHGLKPGSFGGRLADFEQEVHPEDRDDVRRAARHALERGEDYHVVYRQRGTDGATRWLEAFGSVVRDAGGAARRLAGVCMDVTERKVAEEKLRKSEAHLHLTTEAARLGTWQWNVNSGEIVWSPRHKEMWGLEPGPGALHYNDWARAIIEADRTRVDAAIDRCLHGDVDYDVEYRIVPRGGSERRWIRSTGRARFDEAGGALVLEGVSMDVTDRKQAEEQRTLLIHELNHRVKNTLATVQSLASQTLRNTERSRDAHAQFDARLAALSRAHDVLTSESWGGADLREIVERALMPFQSVEGRVVTDGPRVRLSPKQALALSMALHELATNAVKYGALSDATGEVRLTWSIGARETAGTEAPDMVELIWTERGGPPVVPPTRRGFGSRLIERSLATELDGEVSLDYRPGGVVCTMVTRLERSRARGKRER